MMSTTSLARHRRATSNKCFVMVAHTFKYNLGKTVFKKIQAYNLWKVLSEEKNKK